MNRSIFDQEPFQPLTADDIERLKQECAAMSDDDKVKLKAGVKRIEDDMWRRLETLHHSTPGWLSSLPQSVLADASPASPPDHS